MAKKKNDQVEVAPAVAETKPAVAKPVKNRGESSLLKRGLPGLVLGVLLVLAVQAGIYFFAGKIQSDQSAALTGLYRQHYLAMLDNYTRIYEGIAKALPDAELLPYLQPQAEPDMGLVKRIPGAIFARVVPATIDPASPNGLSYAHQDMVLRLADGKRVTPEISFYESGSIKEQVLTYARLIKATDGTTAVALVSFPFKDIASALKSFAPDAGKVELIQKSGSERASIISSGEGEEQLGADVSTSNPGWELRFSPAPGLGHSGDEGNIMLALGVFVALAAGGLFAWILVSLQRAVDADITAVDSFSENYFRYGNRQRPLLSFSNFSLLMAHLDQYGSELRAGKAVNKPSDNLGSLEMVNNDTALLGDAPEPKLAAKPVKRNVEPALAVRPEIFRAYDVRGVVGDGLSREVAVALGRAIGSEATARGEQVVVVGRDGRQSGPELSAGLMEGIRASGCDVIDVGMVPTPVLYFAAKTIATGSGVMVTGSHNPANYNGFKIMIAGDTLFGDDIQALRTRIETSDFTAGTGGLSQQNVSEDYVDRVSSDIALARPVRVVVDAGNGVAGAIGPRVLEALGCTVIPLFCEIDGTFPNHHPDPSKPENLEDLMGVVAANNADIGIAFDGDGDRIGVVTAGGKNIFPDRLMMLYSKHVLTTNPGADIIFDVKCTRDLPALISSHGGRPVMCKTGHSFIKNKLKETGAALAGEMSGHIFFNDRWFGFDDAIYSAARLLEILSLEAGSSDEMFAEFPENPSTPEINIAVADEAKFGVMEALKHSASFPDANVITIDGLRVEFADSWGLIRASNTTPCLVARFEGKTPQALAEVQEKFQSLLQSVDPQLKIPF
ncbi:MAG: phosphomannomutase/phosphoglucomutase [Pedobacter sp.]|nr:phosphomannomutase/phosphoglucomutase [Pedobacter sp.]